MNRMGNNMDSKVTIIGAAVVDIMAGAVNEELFKKGSVPAKHLEVTCGGDALNESVVLSNLGVSSELITLLGVDEAAETILKHLRNNGVDTSKITRAIDVATGMNIVLVDGRPNLVKAKKIVIVMLILSGIALI